MSLLDPVLRNLIGVFLPPSIIAPLADLAWQNRLTTMTLDTWQAVLLLFVGQELCYYWYHRAAHRVRWFWNNHAVHHSSNDLTLASAYRIGILGRLSGTAVFFLPLIWLGFSPKVVSLTLAANLLYQFWIHAAWIPKLGWLEYVFNTPQLIAYTIRLTSNTWTATTAVY